MRDEFQELIDEFLRIRRDLLELVKDSRDALEQVHSSHRKSAENLLHYIALRSRDLRPLQLRLARVGLSSLGRAESHVLAAVDAVLAVLHRSLGRTWQPDGGDEPVADLEAGQRLLRDHTEALLGETPPDRGAAIMVTMPSQAADDYSLVQHLIEHGMDCMRINCAHDDEARWGRMISHLRRAEEATGRRCRVLMDLAGPKLRTGPLEPGPAVMKVKPRRDPFGRVTRPARIWLSARESPRQPPTPADAAFELPDTFLKSLAVGDRLTFTDARRSKRVLPVVALSADGVWAESTRTCYFTAHVCLRGTVGPATPAGPGRVRTLPVSSTHPASTTRSELCAVTVGSRDGPPTKHTAISVSTSFVYRSAPMSPPECRRTLQDAAPSTVAGTRLWGNTEARGGFPESRFKLEKEGPKWHFAS